MTVQNPLDADVRVVGRWMLEGWRWWIAELAAMVPAALRRPRARGAPWLAEVRSLDGPVRLWRDGALAAELATADGQERRADMALPAGAVLIQELELPRLSPGDLRRLVELNIDRFTPFRSDQVYFDMDVIGPAGLAGRQRVRLAVLTRDRGQAALDLAGGLGLRVQRIGVASGDGRSLQFDFSRVMRPGGASDPAQRRRAWLWGVCAALVVANVLIAVLEDINDVNVLQRLVEAQRPAVTLAARLRRTIQGEQQRRFALLTRRSVQEPLRILDAATRSLPQTVWVQRLEWNGRTVRLVGSRPPGVDPVVALQGPAFRNVRSLASDMATPAAGGKAPFDLMADSAAQAPK